MALLEPLKGLRLPMVTKRVLTPQIRGQVSAPALQDTAIDWKHLSTDRVNTGDMNRRSSEKRS